MMGRPLSVLLWMLAEFTVWGVAFASEDPPGESQRVLVSWSFNDTGQESDGLVADTSVQDLLLIALPLVETPPLGVPGVGILPRGSLPEAAAWLAIADWFGFVPGPSGNVRVEAMIKDNTVLGDIVNASITHQQFSPATDVQCSGAIRLYSRQGAGGFNPSRRADAILDDDRAPGARSWEVRDQLGVERERGSKASFRLVEQGADDQRKYAVEVTVVELLDRGDGREEYFDRSLACTSQQRLLLSELNLDDLNVWNVDEKVYARFQPDMQTR